jgi:excisionase family DNA binding protein
MTAVATERDLAPLLYKIPEVCALLRLSRSEVYDQIKDGRIKTVHQGRAVFVAALDLAAYVELLRAEARAAR